jgi:hypothetical protein
MTVGYQVDQDDNCYAAPHYSGVGYKTNLETGITATSALSQMASPGGAYLASNASTMSQAFAGIASKLTGAKLVPDSDAG